MGPFQPLPRGAERVAGLSTRSKPLARRCTPPTALGPKWNATGQVKTRTCFPDEHRAIFPRASTGAEYMFCFTASCRHVYQQSLTRLLLMCVW